MLLAQAVADFNAIDVLDRKLERVGLIGEIFVKFNNYAQANITEWLKSKKVEVSVPPLLDFLLQLFVNSKVNDKNGTSESSIFEKALLPLVWKYINKHVKKSEKIMSKFKLFEPSESIFAKAKNAEEVIDLSNQFGEGWLIPGRLLTMQEKE